jgi:phosphoenolpyruvate synthase/pyruvate phosphate dikinase
MVSGGADAAEGSFVPLLKVEDLLAVMESGQRDLVAYLVHPNVTMMAPIYDVLSAIVCRHGDDSSHVAIVSRELGIPCVVRLELAFEVEELAQARVRLEPSGELWAVSDLHQGS